MTPADDASSHTGAGVGSTDADAGQLSRFARGGVLNLAASILSGILGFILVVVLTRGLGASGAGPFFVALAAFSIASNTLELGADTGAVRLIARHLALGAVSDLRTTFAVALVPVFAIGSVAATCMWVFAPQLAHIFGHGIQEGTVETYLRALAPFVPLASAYTVSVATTRGFGTILPTVLIDKISRPLLQPLFATIVFSTGAGAAALAVAYAGPIALGFVAGIVTTLALLRRAERTWTGGDARRAARDLAAEFWSFTAPRGLAAVFQVGILWLDTLLIGALATAREAGIYTAASRYIQVGSFVLVAVIQVIAPQISDLFARHQIDDAKSVYQTATWWLIMLTWPGYLTLACFATPFLQIFGHGFVEGATVLAILSGAMLIAMACGPVDVVLLMAGKSSWNLLNTVVALALNIGLNLLLIPRIGMEGAAIAWAVSIAVNNLAPLVEVRFLLGLDPFGSGFLTAVGTTVGSFAIPGLLIRWIVGPTLGGLAIFALVSVPTYAFALWRFRGALRLAELRRALSRKSSKSRSTGG
ncbi:MAG: polysaccharide biosynthesis C-terminal domain-containing protein [Actinomycetota bacterium]